MIAGDLERVRELLAAEKKLEKKIEKEEELKQEQRQKKDKILPSHIAQVVAKWTHIPVEQMEEAEKERLKKLDAWSMYLITSYQDAERYIGRKADKNRKIYNGMIRTYYYQFLGPKPPKRREGETR